MLTKLVNYTKLLDSKEKLFNTKFKVYQIYLGKLVRINFNLRCLKQKLQNEDHSLASLLYFLSLNAYLTK